jgi:hypothetical protein
MSKIGQNVLLNGENFTMSEGLIPKFMSIFAGPFQIVEQVFKDIYKLELLRNINVHLTFYISLFKPLKRRHLVARLEAMMRPPPDLLRDYLEYEIECILKCMNHKQKNFLVK